MYMLHSLTRIIDNVWELAIWRPGGDIDITRWQTNDIPAALHVRVERIVNRRNCEYMDLRSGKTGRPAMSHWRVVAAMGPDKTNLEKLKAWNSQRIREFKAAQKRGRKKDV